MNEFHFIQGQAILLGPVFFQTSLPSSGGYHLERNGIPLHDAVGTNRKKGTTSENQGASICYIDMTTPPRWREKVTVYCCSPGVLPFYIILFSSECVPYYF